MRGIIIILKGIGKKRKQAMKKKYKKKIISKKKLKSSLKQIECCKCQRIYGPEKRTEKIMKEIRLLNENVHNKKENM